MNKVQMFSLSLAAILAGPVHAQVCSGGSDGGMDATGNQCNTIYEDAAFAAGSAITPPAQVKEGREQASASAKHPAVRSTQMPDQKSKRTAMAVPASRKLRAAAPPTLPAKAAKPEIASETFCSGGASGGMDVNGNECEEVPAAAGGTLVAQHNVR